MMRQYELVERVQRYKPDVNEALLNEGMRGFMPCRNTAVRSVHPATHIFLIRLKSQRSSQICIWMKQLL